PMQNTFPLRCEKIGCCRFLSTDMISPPRDGSDDALDLAGCEIGSRRQPDQARRQTLDAGKRVASDVRKIGLAVQSGGILTPRIRFPVIPLLSVELPKTQKPRSFLSRKPPSFSRACWAHNQVW